jgi:hypothetical protein
LSDNGHNEHASKSECASTQTDSGSGFSVNKFMFDDKGIHFYTGVETFNRFQFVLRTLGPAAYQLNYRYHYVQNISVEDQFFMTLIKLREDKTNVELSRLFDVSVNTVSNIFITWVNFMYLQWREIDIFPSRFVTLPLLISRQSIQRRGLLSMGWSAQ